MSNLKNASLILKTTDLFDNTPSATILGYYYTTTTLVVGEINGYIPSNLIIPNVSTGTPDNTINTDGYGTITLNTATTATTSHLTKAMTSVGNFLSVTTPNARVSSVITGNRLVLTTANTNVSVGQFITGTGIHDNTQIIAGSGTIWEINNPLLGIQTITTSFWTIPAINLLDGVYGTSYVEGTTIVSPPQSNTNNGLYYIINIPQTIASENVSFYPQQQIQIYNNDLTNATYQNSNGSCNQFRTSMTWNSINLRTLLGDMYNDYDLFNLCLNSIATAVPHAEISTNNDNLNVIVKVSGLPFINQTYDVANGHNKTNATICAFRFDATNPSTELYYANNIATFGKNQELCNITIYYERIIDGKDPSITAILPPQTPAVVSPFPNCIFNFDIIGVEKYNKNGSRLS